MLKRLVGLFLLLMTTGISVYAQTCEEFPTADDYVLHGNELEADGFLQDAIVAYSCAVEIDPENLDYLTWRGNAYYDAENYDEALADYNLILELDETYPYAWNNRANIHYIRGEVDLALEEYSESIRLDDSPTIAYHNRAMVYYERGEYIPAEGDLLRVVDLDPTYKEAYLSLAWVYDRMDDYGAEHPYFALWIEINTTETEEITLSGSVEDVVYEMKDGMLYRMTFEGVAGQVINISARANPSQDADPLLVLEGVDFNPIASDDDSGVNLDAVISNFELPADGTYRLLLSHSGFGATGDITVSIDLGEEGGIDIANSFSTFNLLIGEVAQVYTTVGDRLNLRSGPGLEFEILTKLEPNTLVTLLEGPRKAEGYAWWRVRDDAGNEGWAVERVDEEQTLQLALIVGEDAIVTTGGDKLNVRTGAGTGNDLAFQLDEGAQVTLLEAPQAIDGFNWWHIQTEDGQEGWTIDRFDGDRMLIPAKEIE